MALELVTYADIKALLDLEETAITGYPSLGVIRDGVTAAIEEYLGRQLEKIARTETGFVSSPTVMISLPGVPVTSVASVVVTEAGVSTTYTSADYEITGYGIKLYTSARNCKVVVTYTGGWEAADVPDAVSRAALLQTAYEFQSKDQIGAQSVSTEGGTVNRPELGLLKEVKRMLNRFKHPLKEN